MSNKETLQSYNNRLNANNTSIDDILDIIDNLPEAGTGGSSAGGAANVYVQADEPSGKKGLWLQASEPSSTNTVITNSRIVEETVFGTWVNRVKPTYRYASSSATGGAVVGDSVFMLGGYNSGPKQYAQEYSVSTGEYIDHEDLPVSFGYHAAAAVGTDIYLFGGYHKNEAGSNVISDEAYRYNTITHELQQITSMPDARYTASAVSIGNYIYIIGGRKVSNGAYQTTTFVYDIATNQYETISGFPNSTTYSGVVAIGSKIYILGSNGIYNAESYVYDLTTNTLSSIAPIPNTGHVNALAHNELIYYFTGANTQMYVYDPATDTHSAVENVIGSGTIAGRPIFNAGGKFVRWPTSTNVIASSNIDTLDYVDYLDYQGDEDGVVIYQRNGVNKYNTELVSAPNISGKLLSGFEDVIYYTTANGVNNTIPTYYGNGSEWIKFKN